VLVVDVYWKRPPRLAIRLPAEPGELGLVNPYPDLEESWSPGDREWGWSLGELDAVPDVRDAVEIAQRFQPETGPMSTEKSEVDREHIRRQLERGLTPDQIYEANGRSRSDWLAAIEEEARLEDELGACEATADAVVALRDERHLRWERIAARVFGDARRVREVRALYDEAKGEGASAQSYTGRGRRFAEMDQHGSDIR
jgi:hypothetical protein